jgi:hypothetical protein
MAAEIPAVAKLEGRRSASSFEKTVVAKNPPIEAGF